MAAATARVVLLGSSCVPARCRPRMSTARLFSAATLAQTDLVGFVGLGNMGNHMAANLLKTGHSLIVYDISEAARNQFRDMGAQVANSPAEIAKATAKIVTMLPSSPHVLEVYRGKDGLLSQVQEKSLLIDSSTIDPAVSQQVAEEAQKLGATLVDAPVSGGVNAARDAALTFMVGSPQVAFTQVKELLTLMGKNVIHCGPVGTGQAAKICNNMLLAISMIGTSEAMNLGIRLGLDPKILASILNVSSGRCWSSEVYNPCPGVKDDVPASNDYKGGFGSALMNKDLGLAEIAASNTKSPIPLGSLAHQIYTILCNQEFAKKDFSCVFHFLQKMNGP